MKIHTIDTQSPNNINTEIDCKLQGTKGHTCKKDVSVYNTHYEQSVVVKVVLTDEVELNLDLMPGEGVELVLVNNNGKIKVLSKSALHFTHMEF